MALEQKVLGSFCIMAKQQCGHGNDAFCIWLLGQGSYKPQCSKKQCITGGGGMDLIVKEERDMKIYSLYDYVAL